MEQHHKLGIIVKNSTVKTIFERNAEQSWSKSYWQRHGNTNEQAHFQQQRY